VDSQNLVVVGLGNPGSRYDGTRHNIGFAVVDALKQCSKSKSWIDVSTEALQFSSDALSGRLDQRNWLDKGDRLEAPFNCCGVSGYLIKPRTFMNRSGEPLRDFLSFRKIPLSSVIVVHDEIDIPVGQLRLKIGGGEGGHNGLRSIVSACGGKDFGRIRAGVGKPPAGSPLLASEDGIAKWVLSRYTAEERGSVETLVGRAAAAVLCLALEGLATAQNRFNS
jgi:PTH1 family peptidyl-tRNA hydrolase